MSLRSFPLFLFALALACGDETPSFPIDVTPDAGGTPDECTPDAPCVLDLGVRGQGLLAEVGDEDPWTFTVPAAGQILDLRVFNDATVSQVQLEVALFGPGGVALTNQRSGSGVGRQRVEIRRLVEPGPHRVVIRDVGGDGADRFNPYFVEVDLLPAADTNEPNDTPDVATPLAFGTPVSGAIATQGDRDWFAVDLTAGRRVEIRASAPGDGPVRHRWSLFAPDATTRIADSTEPRVDPITGMEDAWPIAVRAVGPTGGRFLILVEDDGGDGAEMDRFYTLEVRELDEPDPQEGLTGNETPETATPATPGLPVNGYLASTADADWYAIDVPSASPSAPQIVRARVSYPAASEVELQLALYEPDAETPICERRDGDACKHMRFVRDGAATTGPTELETAHLVDAPGRYLVSVRDLQGDEYDGNVAYTIEVALPDDPDPLENHGPDRRSAAIPVPAATATTGTTITFGWVEGHISYAEDTDWYRFDIPGPVDAAPGQNGDWLVAVEIQMPSPTPVELNAFFFGPDGSNRERYRGLGQRCREPSPDDLDFCQWPDDQNGLDVDFQTTLGSMSGDCFVVFREVTGVGPHYWRMSDLDRDDFDLGPTGRYRLRMTVTAGCPGDSACAGDFLQNGNDLCGRP